MISRYQMVARWSFVWVCVALAGCSGNEGAQDAVVQGTVTIDGVLASRGQVTFHPVKSGAVATGPIHEDGSFSLRIGQGNMARPDESQIESGEYIATVVVNEPADASATVAEGGPPLAGKRLTSIRYSQKDTSGLKFTVKPGRNVFPLDLEGSQNDPPPPEPQVEGEPQAEGEAKADDGDVPAAEDGATDIDSELSSQGKATGSEVSEEEGVDQ